MPKPISIVSIGAGNIAHHFIPALYDIECHIIQVFSRSLKNANHLAHQVDAESITDLDKLNLTADLYLIMVPDDNISDVVSQIPVLSDWQVLAHTSGATNSSRLKSRANNYGAFYALQSFRKNKELDIKKTPFLIYGNNNKSTRLLRTLARKLSSNVKEINDKERLTYHLAAVFVNNFTNHLSCVANEILKRENLTPETLHPIIATTFERIINADPCSSQTGPAMRNDVSLQKRHLKLIQNDPDWQKLYKSISKSIIQLYNEDNK